MKSKNEKKKLLIEIAVIALAIVIFAVVVMVDTFKAQPSVELNVESAQTVLKKTGEKIPLTVAYTANFVIEETQIKVTGVEAGEGREQILHCTYSTIDVFNVYKANKEMLFNDAYAFYLEEKAAGNMVNATKVRQHLDKTITPLLENAPRIEGEYDVLVYELESAPQDDAFVVHYDDTVLRVYLSDEMVDTVYGGLVSVGKDIKNTKTLSYEGKTIDIEKINTLRTGISDCFGLQNFSSAKPDTSPYFLGLWNDFCDDFYLNFIKGAKWTYLAKGLITTLEITLLAALLGIVLGFVCAIIRVTHDKTGKMMIPDQIVRAYLAIIRGTPVMIQLLIIYFVILLPAGVAKFPSAVICFALNSGAYVAEIVRGGIMSVDNGQIEAGRSLGLNYIQTMYHIVVPQAFKAVLPSLANEFITLLKESSVAFYIGVADLTQGGLKIRSITYSNFMPLIAVAVIYFIIVMILTKLVKILERRLRKDER